MQRKGQHMVYCGTMHGVRKEQQARHAIGHLSRPPRRGQGLYVLQDAPASEVEEDVNHETVDANGV